VFGKAVVRRLPVITIALLLHACGGEEAMRTPLELTVAPGGGDCAAAQVETEAVSALQGDLLRLTVLQRITVGATPTLLCDRVVELQGLESGETELELESDTTGQLDLLVEVFAKGEPPRLLASGILGDLDLEPPRRRPLRVLLVRAERVSCAPGKQTAPRAFHSATLLPSQQVLLVGGVTRAATGLQLEPTIELYEPRTGTFTAVEGDLPQPRAFHSALLLSGPERGPYDLLLVGGITADPAQPGSVIRAGQPTDPLPLVPTNLAQPARSVVIRVYPWAEPPQVQQLEPSPALRDRFFHVAVSTGSGVVALGGLQGVEGGRLSTVDNVEVLPTEGETAHQGPFPLQRARVGAVSAPLSSEKVLVFGGNLDSGAGKVNDEVAEIVELQAAPAVSTLAQFEPGSAAHVQSVAFATLSELPDGGHLLVGGFLVGEGGATQLRADSPIQRLNLVGGSLRVTKVVEPAGFTPVAFHSAVALPDQGQILISGGMTNQNACGAGLACDRVLRFDANSEQVSVMEPLRAPRFGHRVTSTGGDILLISGGLRDEGMSLSARAGAELFSHGSTGGVDAYGRAPGRASANSCAP
jgi:hypothetical protein